VAAGRLLDIETFTPRLFQGVDLQLGALGRPAGLPAVHRRRESGDHSEVLTEETRGKRPRYYLQNFHFQSGGWMTDESAQRYDTQVEVLFNLVERFFNINHALREDRAQFPRRPAFGLHVRLA
jgi:hypothetical protein